MLPALLKIVSVLLLAAISQFSFADDDLYLTHCAQCHQKTGEGLVGQFPRLAGRFAKAANDARLRDYMIKAVMFGQAGRIVVDGQAIIGAMPVMGLSDEELVDVLDTIANLGAETGTPASIFSIKEIAKVRAAGQVVPSELSKLRKQLVAEKVLP